jgi:electron transfer flavoprotein alpha subunit
VKDKDMTEIWILVAANPAIDNLVSRGRELGGQLVAVVAGDRSCAEAIAASGVDKVVWLGELGQTPVEARAAAVADLVAQAAPRVVLTASHPAERVLAGAVAGRLGAPALTMVSSVRVEADAVIVTHATFGGIAEETVRVEGPVVIVDEGGSVGSGGVGADRGGHRGFDPDPHRARDEAQQRHPGRPGQGAASRGGRPGTRASRGPGPDRGAGEGPGRRGRLLAPAG